MIEVRLFGSGTVNNLGRTLAGFPNQQFYQVLCYLILYRRQTHSREKLAATFWTDYPTSASRKYLRDALWRLRHSLGSLDIPAGNLLIVSDEQVSFQLNDQCWLDVELFESTLQGLNGTPQNAWPAQAVEKAEQAVDLYTADLLDGLYTDWCLHERERLRMLYFNVLVKLVDHHEANGHYEKAIRYCEKILAGDVTREMAHRQLMRLYFRLGDRDAAIRQYKSCVQVLQETLGMSPLPETTRLYTQILHNQLDLHSPPINSLYANSTYQEEDAQLLIQNALQRVRSMRALLDNTRTELSVLETELARRLSHSGEHNTG